MSATEDAVLDALRASGSWRSTDDVARASGLALPDVRRALSMLARRGAVLRRDTERVSVRREYRTTAPSDRDAVLDALRMHVLRTREVAEIAGVTTRRAAVVLASLAGEGRATYAEIKDDAHRPVRWWRGV